MKYLRGSFLGTGPVYQGFRSANIRFRTFRRLPTFRSSKVYGTNDSLYKATQAVENSKSQLVHLSNANSPNPDVSSQARCKVPLTRVKEFPMINETRTSYIAPKTAISIKPNNDIMLRRTLSLMPAVTKVLGATLSAKSQQALDRWKQGLISTLGEEGYQHFVENQLRQGSNFHSAVGKFLLNDEVCKDDLCMKSMKNVFPHITDIGVIESQVVHPQLAYRGVVDCVAKYKYVFELSEVHVGLSLFD
uniref:Mitochondrial genome maintenance exonuclease 1 n=1 Tax=Lygus hesperus TaxID=30085 RepID=A0A0A9YZ87_LYGHE